jgi:hypothetical protein
MIDRALGVAGLGLGVISLVLLTVYPVINKYIAWAGLMLGAVLIVAAVFVALLPEGATPSPSSIKGKCNAIGNGNAICNDIN